MLAENEIILDKNKNRGQDEKHPLKVCDRGKNIFREEVSKPTSESIFLSNEMSDLFYIRVT